MASSGSAGLGVGALVMGVTGALFGLGGFVAVVVGDDLMPLDILALIAVGFAVFGLSAAALVRDASGPAAIGMATVTVGYVILLGDTFGSWWARYQVALATSGAAETAFWSAMPAMGLFAVSTLLFAFGAVLAALRWDSTTPLPNTSLEGLP